MRRSEGMSLGLGIGVFGLIVSCTQMAKAGQSGGFASAHPAPAATSARYVTPYYFPSFGGFGALGYYGGYYSPFINLSYGHTTDPYLPKYWWVERQPSADPRQDGYNPTSGYTRDEATTLLLSTYPAKARIVLDGIFVGSSDSLGPMQLPVGMHTLRVEAPGFETSETVLNVEEPVMQQLEVRLKPSIPLAAK